MATNLIEENDLGLRYSQFKAENPKVRIRDAAVQLGVSEMALVASGVGSHVVRLRSDWSDILQHIKRLGRVMALTRNEHIVHERKGVYNNVSITEGHMSVALVLDPEIDLRIFLRHWSAAYAVAEETRIGLRKSLQFFDRDGEAVHKIYLTDDSDQRAFDELVDTFKHREQTTQVVEKPVTLRRHRKPDNDIDVQALHEQWDVLQDTHDFYAMLQKLKVDRLQALRLAGEARAVEVSWDSVKAALQQAADSGLEIMVFVGSRGTIQIHTGAIKNLKTVGDWYNVLDPEFNLHIRETAIASSWLVKKPTVDGQVTAVECYDEAGEQLLQLFGKRKPGSEELSEWRSLAEALEKKS